jgi:hypothetical protein
MNEKDTNRDETNVDTEGMGDRNSPYFELPHCCRPMVERMMKAFKSAQEETQGSGPPDCCKSMMTRMMKARSEPPEGDGVSPAESQGACCGEPG